MLLESLQAIESIIIENIRLLCSTNKLSKDLIKYNLHLSLVFLVNGASYEASYETSFASVLYDSALRER